MKANIKLQLSKLTPLVLLALLRQVFLKMTGNLNFTTPAVPLAQIDSMADALQVAIDNAKNGGLNERQVRNALVLDAKDMLRVQADYVRSISAGDPVKLGSSGYAMAKTPEPIGPLMPATKLVASISSISGNIDLNWKDAYGTKANEVFICDGDPNVPTNWELVDTTSKSKYTVTGLTSGKTYYFAVISIGAAGKSGRSDVARGMAA